MMEYYSQFFKNVPKGYLRKWTKVHDIRGIRKWVRQKRVVIPNIHSLLLIK